MGYVLIIAISVAVGVGVYRMTDTWPSRKRMPETWAGAGPALRGAGETAPTPDQLRAALDRRATASPGTIGSSARLGLVVVVAVGAASLAFAVYLVASTALSLLEKAAGP